MRILPGLILCIALVVLSSPQTGYCKNNAIVSLLPPEPLSIAKGASAETSVTFAIKDGYHIQANPVKNEFLIPASLNMKPGKNSMPGEPVYPAGNPYILEGSQDVLLTYEKKVVIRLPIAVKQLAKTGIENLTGEFYFQPCTSRRCLSPRSIPVSIPVKIIVPGNNRGRDLQ